MVDSVNWLESNQLINRQDFELDKSGHIGDCPGLEVEVDFANRYIGFYTTATQEEILFGCSPEMCAAVLLYDALTDEEAAVIAGAKKICNHKGYGTVLECVPLSTDEKEQYDPNKVL